MEENNKTLNLTLFILLLLLSVILFPIFIITALIFAVFVAIYIVTWHYHDKVFSKKIKDEYLEDIYNDNQSSSF